MPSAVERRVKEVSCQDAEGASQKIGNHLDCWQRVLKHVGRSSTRFRARGRESVGIETWCDGFRCTHIRISPRGSAAMRLLVFIEAAFPTSSQRSRRRFWYFLGERQTLSACDTG